MRRTLFLTLSALTWFCGVSVPALAERASADVIRFYRCYVPHERIQDWPVGGERYLPVDVAEFERRLRQLQPQDTRVPPAVMKSAQYEARLVGEELRGKAIFTISLLDKPPLYLPLVPFNLAVLEAKSFADEKTLSEESAAANFILGNNNQGDLCVVLKESGKVETVWSLAGRRQAGGVLEFSFQLPTAPAAKLVLFLPPQLVPRVDQGLVFDEGWTPEQHRRWRIELGGSNGCRLQIVPRTIVRRPLVALLHETRTYDCSLRGLEVTVQWRLQAHNEPLREVTALLDAGLHPVAARLGEDLVSWSAAGEENGRRRIKLLLPEPVRDVERVLRLTAFGPLRLDVPWRLPGIRPEGLFWQEGVLRLFTNEPLLLRQIAPRQCCQTEVGVLSPPRVGRTARFLCYDADATVEVLLSRSVKNGALPTDRVPSSSQPASNENSGTEQPPPPETAWAWSLQTECLPQEDGRVRYLCEYQLHVGDRQWLCLRLPPKTMPDQIAGVWLDGQPTVWRASETGKELQVKLVPSGTLARLSVEWRSVVSPLRAFGRVEVLAPEPDVPVFSRRCYLRLPPAYISLSDRRRRNLFLGKTEFASCESLLLELGPHGSATLYVVRKTSLYVLAGLIFLAMAVVARTGFSGRRRQSTTASERASLLKAAVWLIVLSALAWFLPEALLVLVLSAICGILAGLIWRWLHLALNPSGAVLTSGVLLSVCLTFSEPASAAVISSKPFNLATLFRSSSGLPAPYRVLVPIDAERKIAGNKIYLPEAFYKELFRPRAQSNMVAPWLITAAAYQGELVRDTNTGLLNISHLRAKYKLLVLEQNTPLKLPFGKDGPSGLMSAVLDGRAVEPLREADALLLGVADAGEHLLELCWQPRVRRNENFASMELNVPPVHAARLELSLPSEAPAVEVPSAFGGLNVEALAGRLTAELGPTDRLVVRWPVRSSGLETGELEVEQLTWLKLRPGSVALEVKFKLSVVSGTINRLRLALDPRLRLLPLKGDNPPTVHVDSESGQARVLVFQWPQPIAHQTVLEATLLLSGTSGIGKLRPPRIEVLDGHTKTHLLAVSVDSALECEQQPAANPTETIENFLRAWGPTNDVPQSTYRMRTDLPAMLFSCRPRQPQAVAEQTLDLYFERQRISFRFHVDVSLVSGYLFHYVVSAPQALHLEKASVQEEQIERLSYWARDEQGRLTLFLTGPASGRQQIELTGSLPIDGNEKQPLPTISLLGCEIRSAVVRIFRRSGVSLKLVDTANCHEISPSATLPQANPAWGSAAYVFDCTNRERLPKILVDSAGKSSAVVHSVQTLVAWQADKLLRGITVLDFTPDKKENYVLLMPPGSRPVRVTINGVPIAIKQLSENIWRLPKVQAEEPQKLIVVFYGVLPAGKLAEKVRLDTPCLAVLRTQQETEISSDKQTSLSPAIRWEVCQNESTQWFLQPPLGYRIEACEDGENTFVQERLTASAKLPGELKPFTGDCPLIELKTPGTVVFLLITSPTLTAGILARWLLTLIAVVGLCGIGIRGLWVRKKDAQKAQKN